MIRLLLAFSAEPKKRVIIYARSLVKSCLFLRCCESFPGAEAPRSTMVWIFILTTKRYCVLLSCPLLWCSCGQSGKFVRDKSRVELHRIITENFLTPVRKALLKDKAYRATHSRQDIEAKFGSRGVRGFRGWVASQRLQERMRRSRLKDRNGLDGNDKLSNFENLRSQMFTETEEVDGDRRVESLRLDSSPSSLDEVAAGCVVGSSSRPQQAHNGHVCQDGNHTDAPKGPAADSMTRNEFDGEKTNGPSRSSTIHGKTSSAAVDESSFEDGGQAMCTSKGGKGKARMPEEADSSAKVQGGDARDGADGHGNEVSSDKLSDGDLDMAVEDAEHLVDNSVIDNQETAIESITSDNLPASEERHKSSQREGITGVIEELRRLRDESRRLHSIRLEQMQIEDRRTDALEKVSYTLSQVASSMSKANASKGGEEAVKNLRSLLDLHNDPKFDVVVDGDNFREALAEANRQQLTREDGQALLSLILEINDNDSIDVRFTAMEVHPAYRASKI